MVPGEIPYPAAVQGSPPGPPLCSPRKVLREIRRAMQGQGDKRRGARYTDDLKRATRERRNRTSKKEKRRFPQRRKHKPPQPPVLLKPDEELKSWIRNHL